MIARFLHWFARIPGPTLSLFMVFLSLVPLAFLAIHVVKSSRQADFGVLTNIGESVVQRMQVYGATGARNALLEWKEAWPEDLEGFSAALWQGTHTENDSQPGYNLQHSMGPVTGWSAISNDGLFVSNDQRYLIYTLDISEISKDRKWSTPANELVQIALAVPGRNEKAARSILWPVGLGYSLLLAVAVILYKHSDLRYRRGLASINSSLAAFAGGRMKTRLPDNQTTAELSELSIIINPILDRLDLLIGRLQRMGVEAAHELLRPIKRARLSLGRNDEFTSDRDRDIDDHLRRAIGNVKAMMELVRLDSESGVTKEWPVMDLSDLLERRIELMEGGLTQEDRSLDVLIAPDVHIRAEADLMAILLENLLSNVEKYAATGAKIRVGLETSADQFRFFVANTGAFPTDIRFNALEPYSRSKEVMDIPGMGLGLGLVARICERYEFDVRITPSEKIAEVVVKGAFVQPVSLPWNCR